MNNNNKIKKLLIEWLLDEYILKEATKDINEAKIIQNKEKIIIEYNNGVKDIVVIKNNEVIEYQEYLKNQRLLRPIKLKKILS